MKTIPLVISSFILDFNLTYDKFYSSFHSDRFFDILTCTSSSPELFKTFFRIINAQTVNETLTYIISFSSLK